jgi:drug/metabolite transporter (DMT)-like permease
MPVSPRPPPLPPARGKNHLLLFLAALAAFVAWLVFLPSLPVTHGPLPAREVPCVFQAATGMPCAFCGGTRSLRALARGEIGRALYLNALAPFVALAIGVAALLAVIEALAGRSIIPRPAPRIQWALLVTGLVLLIPWTVYHAGSAISTPKPELANLKHPLVRWIRGHPGPSEPPRGE